jgi:hypothetical protein
MFAACGDDEKDGGGKGDDDDMPMAGSDTGGSDTGGSSGSGGTSGSGARGGNPTGGTGNSAGDGGVGNDGGMTGEGGTGNSSTGGTDAGAAGDVPGGAGGEDTGDGCPVVRTRPCYSGPSATRNVGVCMDGTETCVRGVWGSCRNQVLPSAEICNGFDDDCNPTTPDAGEDARIDAPCDGTDTDLCNEGMGSCANGQFTCSDNTSSTTDLCGGGDEDCDPASADGAEDTRINMPCDGEDSDLCTEGMTSCSSGMIACNDNTSSSLDLCGGGDDDCDPASADGSEDTRIGMPCDGSDSDLCNEGTGSCSNGQFTCSDNTGSTVDNCGSGDEDCDPASADGSEDARVGQPCDGADSDLCNEGNGVCSNGTFSCSDNTGSTLDNCGGGDEDCDPASADASEDTRVGAPCDGTDSDLCNEGQGSCANGMFSCSDNTGSTVDNCGAGDEDCDPASADGSEDPAVGLACDGADTDQCNEGVRGCVNGGLVCSDNTMSTAEACNGDAVDEDCDGLLDEDWTRNQNPVCSAGTFFLGSISGDLGTEIVSDTYYQESWDLFELTEDNTSSLYLSATITLTSPAGADYDLYVYCVSCGGTLAGQSIVGGLTGHTDTVRVRMDDDPSVDDTADFIVEVRHYESNRCAYWDLDITGNTSVTNVTCP